MNLLKIITILFVSISLVSSCKKDDATTTKTPIQLLKDGTWKLNNITVSGVPFIDSCEKDNTYVFGETKVTLNEGATKCNSSDPQTDELPYTLSSDGKTFNLDGDDSKVIELSASKFIFEATTTFGTFRTELVK